MGQFGRTHAITVTPTITAGAYSAADVVGGLMQFNIGTPGGFVMALTVGDGGDVKAAGTLYLFDSMPASITDNGVFAGTLVDADAVKYIGKIAVAAADYDDFGNQSSAVVFPSRPLPYAPAALFAYFVCTATPTYGSTSDLSFKLVCMVD